MNAVIKILFGLVMVFLLAYTVAATDGFSILSPENTTYNNTMITVSLSGNQTYDAISYYVDSEDPVLGCTNCSSFITTLNLSEGSHTLHATALLGNESFNNSVDFSIELPVSIVDFNIDIDSPENVTYDHNQINMSFGSNITLDSLSYKVDGSYVLACENCSIFSLLMNFSEDSHTLTVKGALGNITKTETVHFSVEQPVNTGDFSFKINNPKNTTYDWYVPVEIKSNRTLDKISVKVGSKTYGCTNCAQYKTYLYLTRGTYTLYANGTLGDIAKSADVSFSVLRNFNAGKNQTYNWSYWYHKYDKGFENLPQMVVNGSLTDDELADIIRNNQLNPGIINRLIKTGMLGNASLEAIIDTQFSPPGIFGKLWGFLGFKQKSFSELIYEEYDINGNLASRLILRYDLPKQYQEKIRTKLKNEINRETNDQNDSDADGSDNIPGTNKSTNASNHWLDTVKVFKIVRQDKHSASDPNDSTVESKDSGSAKKNTIKVAEQDDKPGKGNSKFWNAFNWKSNSHKK